ncbi:hypothetical protein MATL_G00144190 [Megalops atlanticus]|uniref:Cadherin-5 n=1 Tax=Megalops atlanticus TaxID=7932 RepID=A0A9D3PX18_MEGAT|nr:hypothetical protein MATL_G00144190 [Megalops atlanticus]
MGRPAERQTMGPVMWMGVCAFALCIATTTAEHTAPGRVLARQKRDWQWNFLFLEEEKSDPPPHYVGKLKSTNYRERTKFIIQGEGADKIFWVNGQGDIYANRKLDREEKAVYNLTAYLIDMDTGETVEPEAKFLIQITDLNDNSPQFPKKYAGSIAERSPQGTEVLTVTATDADDPTTANGRIAYKLLNGTDLFDINGQGTITTKVNYLDREKQSSYVIVVHAKDMPGMNTGGSATTAVTIDVTDINDNMASFTKNMFRFTVKEDEKENSEVGVMDVEDKDEVQNKDPSFSFKLQSCRDVFEITRNPRGDAALTLKQRLDYETQVEHRCEVTLQEGSVITPTDNAQAVTTATAIITVLDVDEPPLFTQSAYNFSIREDARINSEVGTVSARDPDKANLKIRYSIDDPNCPVSIHPDTGRMVTTKMLDRELIPVHTCHVTAVETGMQGLKSYATVSLVVVDVNDNAPELINITNIYMCHNEAADTVIRTIGAIDKDDHPQHFSFSLARPSSNFTLIDHKDSTASIKVRQGGFDADDQREYVLEILATDAGKPPLTSTTTVVVSLCRCGPDRNTENCKAAYAQTGVSVHALIAILLCILTILVIVILIVLRKRYQKETMVASGKNSEIHEQLVTYDEEGGGEMDTNGYDVSVLTSARNEGSARPAPGLYAVVKKPPAGRADMAMMIEVKKDEADHDRDGIPYDTLHIYGYEGPESLAGSLSSLDTSSDDSSLDYDFLNDWGPRFKTLAELYGVDGLESDYPY